MIIFYLNIIILSIIINKFNDNKNISWYIILQKKELKITLSAIWIKNWNNLKIKWINIFYHSSYYIKRY